MLKKKLNWENVPQRDSWLQFRERGGTTNSRTMAACKSYEIKGSCSKSKLRRGRKWICSHLFQWIIWRTLIKKPHGDFVPFNVNSFTTSNCWDGWIAGPATFGIILSLSISFSNVNLPFKYYVYTNWNCPRMYIKGPSNVLECNI
jgi:hypothetical protein